MDLTIHATKKKKPQQQQQQNDSDEEEEEEEEEEVLLPCLVSHDAVCYECPNHPHRMKVIFKGSTLMPSGIVLNDPTLLQVWMDTFEGAYHRAALERNILGKALRGFLTWWFQVTHLPSDEEMKSASDKRVHFEMKRCPKGYLDILYMSDTTRITRGNRGTIVVVEPISLPPGSAIEEEDDEEDAAAAADFAKTVSELMILQEQDRSHRNPDDHDDGFLLSDDDDVKSQEEKEEEDEEEGGSHSYLQAAAET